MHSTQWRAFLDSTDRKRRILGQAFARFRIAVERRLDLDPSARWHLQGDTLRHKRISRLVHVDTIQEFRSGSLNPNRVVSVLGRRFRRP